MRDVTALTMALAAMIGLGACSGNWENKGGIGPVAGDGGPLLEEHDLRLQLVRYYEAHGREERYRCQFPYIDGLLHAAIVSQSESELVLKIRYHYLDYVSSGDFDDRPGPFPRITCDGVNERDFTITIADGKHTITDMGPSLGPFFRNQFHDGSTARLAGGSAFAKDVLAQL